MDAMLDNIDLLLRGFTETAKLLVASGALAMLLGTVVAVARVSPVSVLRAAGTTYVTLFRNTPLLMLILITYYGMPRLGIDFGFFGNITLAMGVYTSAFIAEALRSGVNGVPLGQAEAARAIGMPFTMTMTQVVLPQAFRIVVPPLVSQLIALTKNTSLAATFGIAEATFRLNGMLRDFPADRWWIFGGYALGYIVIVAVLSAIAISLERRWKVGR